MIRHVLPACIAVLLGVLSTPSSAQDLLTRVELANPSFEVGALDKLPSGWGLFPEDPRATPGASEGSAIDGARAGSLEVALSDEVDDATETEFYLYQSIPARGLAGKRLVLRGALRYEGETLEGAATLWAKCERFDRTAEVSGGYDRLIMSEDWQRAQLVFDVPANTNNVLIALRLSGGGKAWIDDVSLEVVGPAGGAVEGPRPLTDRGLENLLAFTRVLGLVRHFHPSDQARHADWDLIAVDGVGRVERAADASELAAALEEVFLPLGPTLQFFASERDPALHTALDKPEELRRPPVHYWIHAGFGQELGLMYSRTRRRRSIGKRGLPDGVPDPAEVIERRLPGGVTCRVPLALWGDREQTLPPAPLPSMPPLLEPAPEDRATRLAAIALLWNVLQHFYPYFDVVGERWEGSLEIALAKAARDPTNYAFLLTLQELAAKIDDSHVAVTGPGRLPFLSLPFSLGWAEGKPIVTVVDESAVEPHPVPGEELTSLDGEPVEQLVAWHSRFHSAASERVLRDRILPYLLLASPGQFAELELESPQGERRTITVDYSLAGLARRDPLPAVHELESGILYVDLDRLTEEDLQAHLEAQYAARGVVFDLRGYPQTFTPLTLLTSESLSSPTWMIPQVTRPDREGLTWSGSSWPVLAADAQLAGKVAFITNSSAQSAAETFLSFVEAYELAEIVGEPTAGTNGNVNRVGLPGEYTICFTGMKVLKQDGSQHHGVGILPTIPTSRTRQGVIEGRDELLERAIEVVKDIGDTALERGDFLLSFSDSEEALAEYSAGLEQEPGSSELLMGKVNALLSLGEFARAAAGAEALVQLDPEESGSHLTYGAARWASGDLEGALEDFQSGSARWPEEVEFVEYATRVHYVRGQWAEALASAERALELGSYEEWDMRLLHWAARRRLGQEEADAELLSHLEELDRSSAEDSSFLRHTAEVVIGRWSEEQLMEELALGYDDYEDFVLCYAHYYLGTLRSIEGETDEARRHFEACRAKKQYLMHEFWMAATELERL